MTPSIVEVETQRARWVRYREQQGLIHSPAGEFGMGGLGQAVKNLDVRLQFLPSDPEAALVDLNRDVLAWLGEGRPSPYGGSPARWGHLERATSTALVRYEQFRQDDDWARYLALHRHGGLEAGVSRYANKVEDTKLFRLRATVGFAWVVAALQVEVIDRWHIPGPFEFVLALRDTKGAALGSFAEGWAEFGSGFWEADVCLEENILLRWELTLPLEPEALALDVGDRLEQAFGTTFRRHLAQRGQYQDEFDPRFSL